MAVFITGEVEFDKGGTWQFAADVEARRAQEEMEAAANAESAGQGSCAQRNADGTCADDEIRQESPKPTPAPMTPEEQKAAEEKAEKQRKKKEREEKRSADRKKDRERQEENRRLANEAKAAREEAKKAEQEAFSAKAKGQREAREKEAESCPAVFDEKGDVVKFGRDAFGKGKCAARKLEKLTRDERQQQKLKKMEYQDQLSKGGEDAKKNRHKLKMAKRRAKEAFAEENMAVFDDYGRMLKYGLEPLEVRGHG